MANVPMAWRALIVVALGSFCALPQREVPEPAHPKSEELDPASPRPEPDAKGGALVAPTVGAAQRDGGVEPPLVPPPAPPPPPRPAAPAL